MIMKISDEGFTGLEAAIVLIAFVVVAAVFSYVVLGAGFFTTQKSQEVVHTGVAQASSTLEVVGNVYGTSDVANGQVQAFNFSVALAAGGTPVDFNKTTITFSNATQLVTLAENPVNTAAAPGSWTIISASSDPLLSDSDQLLDKGMTFHVMASPLAPLYPNDQFTIALNPSVGASLSIHRTIPAQIQPVNILF